MKYQVLFSMKNNEKYSKLPSAAVVIGALQAKCWHTAQEVLGLGIMLALEFGAWTLLHRHFGPGQFSNGHFSHKNCQGWTFLPLSKNNLLALDCD